MIYCSTWTTIMVGRETLLHCSTLLSIYKTKTEAYRFV